MIELEFKRSGPSKIRATVPGDPAVALPGYYYLFLMSDNGHGPTPSRAAIVQIGERNLDEAPLPVRNLVGSQTIEERETPLRGDDAG